MASRSTAPAASNGASAARPRDPPATTFEADPVLDDITPVGDSTTTPISPPPPTKPYFGLTLVTNWPPPTKELVQPYNTFLQSIRECFDPSDLEGDAPSVYLYDGAYLHVTVATLHPVLPRRQLLSEPQGTPDNDPEYYENLEETWKNFVSSARSRSDWPTVPLRFEIDSCQIGTKAGILLWKETTGGLAQIRSCLKEEAAKTNVSSPRGGGGEIRIHSIPPIVHSTFLRFRRAPLNTNGENVQSKMSAVVMPKLKDTFHYTIIARDVKLACERIPYMHITNHPEYILASYPF